MYYGGALLSACSGKMIVALAIRNKKRCTEQLPAHHSNRIESFFKVLAVNILFFLLNRKVWVRNLLLGKLK